MAELFLIVQYSLYFSVSKIINKHLGQGKCLHEAWTSFHDKAAFWLPESVMMHLLFCCNLGKGADLVTNAAPFQDSNFTPTPIPLAFPQSGPAFAVSSHLRRGDVCPSQSLADFRTQESVRLSCVQNNWHPQHWEPVGTFYKRRRKGKKKRGSWPLKSSACANVQVVKYRNVLEQLLEVMQKGAVLAENMFSHADTWVCRAMNWTQRRKLYIVNWLLLVSPGFSHPAEHLRQGVLGIQCFCWSWHLKNNVFWVMWLKAVFPRKLIDASKLNVHKILQCCFQGLVKAFWNILEDIIHIWLCQMNN